MGNESIPIPIVAFILAICLAGLLFVGALVLTVLVLGAK